MDRLRPREKSAAFIGFTKSEVTKMEKLLEEPLEKLLEKDFCLKLAKAFNHSTGRDGMPSVNWSELQDWFKTMKPDYEYPINASPDESEKLSTMPKIKPMVKGCESRKVALDGKTKLQEVEFEAKSKKDGAWYDVEKILGHRYLSPNEVEVHVRFLGFGADEDEWVDIMSSLRERSVRIYEKECEHVKVGETLLCFQEKRDQAIYYDVTVVQIERRSHDMRGCRCVYLVRKEHDKSEERVWLRHLCWTRPSLRPQFPKSQQLGDPIKV